MSRILQPDDRKTQTASVTSTAGTLTFDVNESVFHFKNAGPNTAFVRFGAVATTADYPILNGETVMLSVPTTTISLICAATQTAAVYVSPGSVV